MLSVGVEPTRLEGRRILSPLRLPIPSQEQRAGRGSRTLVTSLEGWGNSRYTTPAWTRRDSNPRKAAV